MPSLQLVSFFQLEHISTLWNALSIYVFWSTDMVWFPNLRSSIWNISRSFQQNTPGYLKYLNKPIHGFSEKSSLYNLSSPKETLLRDWPIHLPPLAPLFSILHAKLHFLTHFFLWLLHALNFLFDFSPFTYYLGAILYSHIFSFLITTSLFYIIIYVYFLLFYVLQMK